ncbi:hypothetical protein DNTS_013968 [Danionella cerebrum]|uniref:Uncharacterized protein n=1 Tax=Danionella cerebrum TaxID=2873325 RepID=A0A553RH03_9TELE|nr:hypothetical protein DNTS_013968 [Danionella translucida]
MADDLGDEWWANDNNLEVEENTEPPEEEAQAVQTTKKRKGEKQIQDDTKKKKGKKTAKKECFITQERSEEKADEASGKNKKRRKKKTITDVLATSEHVPGSPSDLVSLLKSHYSQTRSVIEQEELTLKGQAGYVYSCFLCSNDLTHSLSSYLKEVCPKWAKVQKQHTESRSVVLLVVCGSALRTIDLIKQLVVFKGQAKVLKLFAKHIKVEEQIKSLSKGVTHIAVGTPARIRTLLEKEGLTVQGLRYLVLDWNHRDQKHRRMVDIPEVKDDFLKLMDCGSKVHPHWKLGKLPPAVQNNYLITQTWIFWGDLNLRESNMGKKQAATGPLSRRPDNSAFKQQRLPAWSPSLTAQTVLPSFYILSAVCLVLGICLLVTVENTHQFKVDYTDAETCDRCLELRKDVTQSKKICICEVRFSLPQTFKLSVHAVVFHLPQGDVFFYYGLRNFHQNLRRYMDSRDDAQMVGRKSYLRAPSSYCAPFDYNANGTAIAPCGAVANSLFNDTFIIKHYPTNGRNVEVPLYRKGIAWYTDKNVKFRNPPTNNTFSLRQAFEGMTQPPPAFEPKVVLASHPRASVSGTTRPLYWQRSVYELDSTDPNNNGFINDDLIVWMREAAFPDFKKLYGVLNRAQGPFTEGLPAGSYSILINYSILCS